MAEGNVVGSAFLEILPDMRAFNAALTAGVRGAFSAGQFTGGVSEAVGSASRSIGKTIGGAIETAVRAGWNAGMEAIKFGGEAAGVAIAGVVGIGLVAGSQLDRLRDGLIALTGSAATAQDVIQHMRATTIATGQSFGDLTTWAQRLIAAGLGVKTVESATDALARLSTVYGRNSQAFQRAAIQLEEISLRGHVTGQMVLALSRDGVPAYKALTAAAEKLGLAHKGAANEGEQVAKAMKDGKITAEAFFQALSDPSVIGPANAVLNSITSNIGFQMGVLKNVTIHILGQIFEPIQRILGGSLRPVTSALADLANHSAALGQIGNDLAQKLKPLQPLFEDLGKHVQHAVNWLTSGVSVVPQLTSHFRDLQKYLGPAVGLFSALAINAAHSLPFLGQLIPTINPLLGLFIGLVAANPALRAAFGQILNTFAGLAKSILSDLSQVVDALAPASGPLAQALVALAGIVSKIAGALAGALSKALAALAPAIAPLSAALVAIALAFVPVAEAIAVSIPQLMPALVALIVEFAKLGPIFAEIIKDMAPFVPEIIAVMIPFLQILTTVLKDLEPALKALAPVLAPLILAFLAWGRIFAPLLTVLLPVVDALSTLVALFLEGGWVAALGAVLTEFEALGIAFGLLVSWPALIIAAIVAIVVGLVLLITHWSQVSKVVGEFFSRLGGWLNNALKPVGAFFSRLGAAVEEGWKQFTSRPIYWIAYLIGFVNQKLASLFVNLVKWLVGLQLRFDEWASGQTLRFLRWGKAFVENLVHNLDPKVLGPRLVALLDAIIPRIAEWSARFAQAAWNAAQAFGKQMLSAFDFTNPNSWIRQLGPNVIKGITQGMKDYVDHNIKGPLQQIFQGLVDGMNAATQSHSPAKLFVPVGTRIMQGVAQGIRDAAHHVTSAFTTVTDGLSSLGGFDGMPTLALAGAPAGGSSGGGVQVSIGQIVQPEADPYAIAHEIAWRVAQKQGIR